MERERYDGVDIVHLLHACSAQFDRHRLLERFRAHWRLLLDYLILSGLIYPAKQSFIPPWAMQDLLDPLQHEVHPPRSPERNTSSILSAGDIATRGSCPQA